MIYVILSIIWPISYGASVHTWHRTEFIKSKCFQWVSHHIITSCLCKFFIKIKWRWIGCIKMFSHPNSLGVHMSCSITYWRLLMSKIIWALRLTNDTLWLLFNCYYQMPNWLHLTNWWKSRDSYPTYRTILGLFSYQRTFLNILNIWNSKILYSRVESISFPTPIQHIILVGCKYISEISLHISQKSKIFRWVISSLD